MAKLTVEEQKEFSVLPADSIVHLKVDELTEKQVNGAHGPWTKLEFKFKVLGIQAIGDGSPVEEYEDIIAGPIWGSVPLRLTDNPENKLRLWAEAILGIELGIGFELDTEDFMNRECRGITSQYDKRSVDAQGRPFKGHQISALLPKPPTHGQPQFQQPQQQQQFQQPAPAQDPWVNQSTPGNDPWATPGFSDEPPF